MSYSRTCSILLKNLAILGSTTSKRTSKLNAKANTARYLPFLPKTHLQVTHIHVEEDSEGEIYIKFDKVSAGEAAIQGLNGRWFGGRMIAASPISDAVYATKFPRVRAL